MTAFTLLLGVDSEADDDFFFSPSFDHTLRPTSLQEERERLWLTPELALCCVSGESAIAGAANIAVEPLELSLPKVAVPGLPEESIVRL